MGDKRPIEVVSALPALRLYRAEAVGDARRLTRQEQEFISSFADPSRGFTLVERALELGVSPCSSLRVEFTFDDGRRGGLVFRKM